MSDDESYLSYLFLASGFIIFVFAAVKSLGYILTTLFKVPFMDEEISTAFADAVITTDIPHLLTSGSPVLDFILFGVLLFLPIGILIMNFVRSLIEAKHTGTYNFTIPNGLCVAGFYISALFYPIITWSSYLSSAVHFISVDVIEEFFHSAYNLLLVPAIMCFISVLVFVGILVSMIVIKFVHKKRYMITPLTEEDIF